MIAPATHAKRDEAARWFAVLRREIISHEDRQAYDRWRRDPANQLAMAELRDLWAALEDLRQPLRSNGAEVAGAVPRPSPGARSIGAALLSVAASAAAAMLVDFNSPWWTSLDWWSR
jgi:ferric-dicitrate binding protein FerR (iron transport regulator)